MMDNGKFLFLFALFLSFSAAVFLRFLFNLWINEKKIRFERMMAQALENSRIVKVKPHNSHDSHDNNRQINIVLKHIDLAESSIMACFHHITLESVVDHLVEQHKRGIHVRLIVNIYMSKKKNSLVKVLTDAGIPTCYLFTVNDNYIIRDSLCILNNDDDFSEWTLAQTSAGALGTSKKSVRKLYVGKFEDIWNKYYENDELYLHTCNEVLDIIFPYD